MRVLSNDLKTADCSTIHDRRLLKKSIEAIQTALLIMNSITIMHNLLNDPARMTPSLLAIAASFRD